ncbi:MAG: AAA family ATPase [Firmicutes bacterium]|nr:AAA family ATPase [Bacillota bacterium]
MVQQRDDGQSRDAAAWTRLKPGQTVTLRAESPLHKGAYECSVIESSPERLRITMPMVDGRLVLVPVGTPVHVEGEAEGGTIALQARVIDRQGGSSRSLLLGPLPEPPAYLARRPTGAPSRTIAVTSGKGGVGKTAFVVNLGVALCELGKRVCVVDGDLGTANVDVILNLTPRFNLAHVIAGEKTIFEVLVEGPGGLVVLPGGSGLQELTDLGDRQFAKLRTQFQQLERYTDILLLDTGSGLSRSVTNFLRAAHETIVITTPEPHAITDAYALLKVISRHEDDLTMRLVVNRTASREEAHDIGQKMLFASQRFLGVDMTFLGYIPEDPAVGQAIRRQADLLSTYPKSRAAESIRRIAGTLLQEGEPNPEPAGGREGRRSFVQRIRAVLGR